MSPTHKPAGVLRYDTLLTENALLDSGIDLKKWTEEEHKRRMLEDVDHLCLHVWSKDLTHVWLDLDDREALKPLFLNGEFDLTMGRPHPDFKWRLVSEWPYTTNESERDNNEVV